MFKFRFQTLLKVRKIRNDEAQQALAEAQRAYYVLQGERTECLHDIEGSGDDLLQLFRRQVKPAEISMFYNYQRYLQYRLGVIEHEIDAASAEVEKRREALLKVRQEYKAMERLKEIMHGRYQLEQERLEMKVIDDMAVTRHARSK
ncbi:MAG: flagellar export protein FliJ [Syntrophaceae bacterium]